jgi:hypothetical protein
MGKSYVREQLEKSPGYEGTTPELFKKKLDSPATSIDNAPEPSPLERDDEMRGSDEPLQIFADEFNPTWGFASRAYPDLLGFRLTHILGPPVSTAGDGAAVKDPEGKSVPVGATMHVWSAPFGPAGASPLTVDQILAYVDESTFVHVQGAGAEELTLSSDEAGGVKLAAKGPALYWNPIADPGLTPAPESLAVRPFMRRGLKVVTWQGNVRDLENFGVTVNNPISADRSMASGSGFPDILEKGDGPIVVTIEAPKRHIRKTDLEALMNAERFEMKASWISQSKIAATSYPYSLWLEGDGAQYTGGGPASLENKRRIGATYQAKLTSDGVGASSKFTLVNATASYSE